MTEPKKRGDEPDPIVFDPLSEELEPDSDNEEGPQDREDRDDEEPPVRIGPPTGI